MFVVGFDKELREAFAAGQASMLPMLAKARGSKGGEKFFAAIPKTYEEWIESKRNAPQIAIG